MVGFAASWRKQEVPIPTAGASSTAVALLVALTGVTVEYQRGLALAQLDARDAGIAARLAMYELNSFPPWFDDLARLQPAAVKAVLRETIEREWDLAAESHGVLRFAPYQGPTVATAMKAIVLELGEARPPGHPTTVHSAGNALLSSAADVDAVGALAARYTKQFEQQFDACAEWARVWVHTEPASAGEWITERRQAQPEATNRLVAHLASSLGRDFERGGARVVSKFFSGESLRLWLPLLLDSVRPEHDVHREGSHFIEDRDDAQELRDRCLNRLAQEGSPEAYGVLEGLRQAQSNADYRANIERALLAHEGYAAELAAEAWPVESILEFERGRDTRPASRSALFDLVRRHMRQIASSQLEEEFSYRELFEPLALRDPDQEGSKRVELTIQRWVASTLHLVSRGLYTVEREAEKMDEKRVDVSATIPGVGQVPIEIKPIGRYIGRYSLADLMGTIERQLLGDYMRPRDVTHGVLLLVQLVVKKHKLGEKRDGTFAEMVSALSEFADRFAVTHGKVIAVETLSLVTTESTAKSTRRKVRSKK